LPRYPVEGGRLRSLVSGESYGIGELELVPLHVLRERARPGTGPAGRLKVGVAVGDVREMHRAPENAGALFQVASQFNLLEMVGPSITPEEGVTRYERDRTQGPACAIAAGAATIYRNYFAPVGEGHGQTKDRQIDALAKLGQALSKGLGQPVSALWEMRNGYALCSREGLNAIDTYLQASPSAAPVRRSGSTARRSARHRGAVTTKSGSAPTSSSLPGNTAATAIARSPGCWSRRAGSSTTSGSSGSGDARG
jgi:hypothetical protein